MRVKAKRDLIIYVSLFKVCHIEESFVYGDFIDPIQKWGVERAKFSCEPS
jgi:hypothetical protein